MKFINSQCSFIMETVHIVMVLINETSEISSSLKISIIKLFASKRKTQRNCLKNAFKFFKMN